MKKHVVAALAGAAFVAAAGAAEAEEMTDDGFTYEITKWLEASLAPGGLDLTEVTFFDFDKPNPFGWGFEIYGDIGFDIALPIMGGYDITGRLYRDYGDTEVGLYAGFGDSIPGGNFGWGFGWDVEHERGPLTFYSETTFFFDPAFDGIEKWSEIEYQANEMLLVGVGAWLGFDGGLDFGVEVWAEYELETVTPYAFAYAYPSFGDYGAGIGVEFERALGTGDRFSLVGYGEVEIGTGFGVALETGIGLRFSNDR